MHREKPTSAVTYIGKLLFGFHFNLPKWQQSYWNSPPPFNEQQEWAKRNSKLLLSESLHDEKLNFIFSWRINFIRKWGKSKTCDIWVRFVVVVVSVTQHTHTVFCQKKDVKQIHNTWVNNKLGTVYKWIYMCWY